MLTRLRVALEENEPIWSPVVKANCNAGGLLQQAQLASPHGQAHDTHHGRKGLAAGSTFLPAALDEVLCHTILLRCPERNRRLASPPTSKPVSYLGHSPVEQHLIIAISL